MSLTIVISHTFNCHLLKQCLHILENVPVLKGAPIHLDGYTSDGLKAASIPIYGDIKSKDAHIDGHGVRCYDLLHKFNTDYVIIMDSDFFCDDNDFWVAALEALKDNIIVSIGDHWNEGIVLPTTPFVAYNRKAVIELLPVREAWNSFSKVWSKIVYPVFDHLKFLFLTAYLNKKDKIFYLDMWYDYKNRRHKFYHFWDSRHPYEQNFKDFSDNTINESVRYTYLSYGITKCIFECLIQNNEVPSIVWYYMKLIKKYDDKNPYNNLEEFILNFSHQINDNQLWLNRMQTIKEIFETNI